MPGYHSACVSHKIPISIKYHVPSVTISTEMDIILPKKSGEGLYVRAVAGHVGREIAKDVVNLTAGYVNSLWWSLHFERGPYKGHVLLHTKL